MSGGADLYRDALVELDRMANDCLVQASRCVEVAEAIHVYRKELQAALHSIGVES